MYATYEKKKSKLLFVSIIILSIGGIGIFYFFSNLPFGPGAQDFTKNLTGGYKLYRMSSNDIIVAPKEGWNKDAAIIPEKVLKLNVSRDFIIAERQSLKRRSPNDSLDTYLIPDPTVVDYWILDTRKKLVIKSLTKQQLDIKCLFRSM